ncbi:synaptotagmin-like protein 2 isoform X3 [Anabas testudineus]|uniref:synaptotagmin-like protein 2 isoform X3 n=1 Tax=Anabas testudineus TaxID=64144 RepID=UPI000E45BD6F|nr:synaptotagmin-like protein 2 isoform X3 [Anabas testudineus]
MIDLSFLTEEEQETILAVLKRDAELKKAEERRVQNLQKTVSDRNQLKYLSGEWFYETKQHRHQDRIHGSDIIRASMRHTHKPLTILELSQILPETSNLVSGENKEVFVPPVLRGLLQEPRAKPSSESYQNQHPHEKPQETPKPVIQSPIKRKNPFNSELNASHTVTEEKHIQVLDRATDQTLTPTKDFSEYCHSERLSPAVLSLVSTEESGKPVCLETEPEEEHHSQAEAADGPDGHSIQEKLPDQSTDVSIQVTSHIATSHSSSSTSSSNAVSIQPRQRLLRMFSSEKDKSAEVQSPVREELNISKQRETGNTQKLVQDTAGTALDMASFNREAKLSGMTGVKTLQLTALQNTAFKETVIAVKTDSELEATESRVVQFPERLCNLKAFWEKENTGPKIIFIREEMRQEDMAKAAIEASCGPQTYVESISNISAHMEMTADATAGQEKSLLWQTECGLSVDLSEKDGTYRANPVLINEETDESLTGSGPDIFEPDDISTPLQSSGIAVSLPSSSSSSPQGDTPAKISYLKHFWEKEYTGPKVIVARVNEISNKGQSPQCDLMRSLDNRETSEEEEQMSPYRTKPSGVLKSLKVTDKGFVTPDRSQLRSSGCTGDPNSSCSQHQVKAKTDSEAGSLSPSHCLLPRSNEQNDEVRRSPSKTCHPRVLPKESSSPKRSRVKGSPLKTFPIYIDPLTKVVKEQQEKPTPVPRQQRSLPNESKQIVLRDIRSCQEGTGTYFSNPNPVNTQQISSSSSTSQFKKSPEKKSETFTHLARSFIPRDYQHYLGPQQNAHSPPFYQEKAAATESDVVQRPQSTLQDFVGNQNDSPKECIPPTVTSHSVHSKHGNSRQDTKTWSLSRASSDSYDGSSSPIPSALKQSFSTSMSSSKSLENLTSTTREESPGNNSGYQRNRSVDDVSSCLPPAAALSNSNQMKTNLSVPVLQLDGVEIDSTPKNNSDWRRNTGSSMSNLSLSSGMASMSSQVSGSMSSIYPADCGDIEVQGSIQFAVNYIQKLGEFQIFVVHCRDLAVADTKRNRSEPYVKCYLLPDKTKLGKRKTTVKKKTLNPTYNEILRFTVQMDVLKTQKLNISVWHNDTFGRNSFLGEVNLDLSEWDFSNTQINEYTLTNRASVHTLTSSPSHVIDSKGQMRVALRFLPQMSHSTRSSNMNTGEVQIWVKDCKNLPSVRGVTIDPFVKCTVLPDTSKKSRQKTRVVKRTANPMFNHTMVYDGFRQEDLREACIELTVWDHDRLNNHYVGGLRIGLGTGKSYGVEVVWMDSTTDEADLWQRMLQSDGEWVEDVLPLRMFVMAKSMSN